MLARSGNVGLYVIIGVVGVAVLAGGIGVRLYLNISSKEAATLPQKETQQAHNFRDGSSIPAIVESKIVCNQLTLFPRQTLGFFFSVDGAPARGSKGFYFVHFGQAGGDRGPALPFPVEGQSGAQALFDSKVYVTEFGVDGIPGTADDRTTAIADATFSPIAANGNDFLFGVGEKLMWYSLGPDGIPKTADDIGPKIVAEKYYSDLAQPYGNVGLAGNVAVYTMQVSSVPQPSPYSLLSPRNTYAIISHDFGADGVPGTSDDYKNEIQRSEIPIFGFGGPKDGRYTVSKKGSTAFDIYDVGPDEKAGTADDKRSTIELKNVKPPTRKRYMKTDEFGRSIPHEDFDSGTGISYMVIDGPHLAFRREVAVWEYMYAGADGRYGTDDDYVADVVTSTGPDNKKILADQNPHLIGNILSLDGGFGGTYFYKFCEGE